MGRGGSPSAYPASNYGLDSDALRYLDEAPAPWTFVSANQDWLALCCRQRFLRLSQLSRPELSIGGLQVDIGNTGPHQWPRMESLRVVRVADNATRVVHAEPGTSLHALGFSADGQYFAFASIRAEGLYLGWVECATGRREYLSSERLNGLCSCLGYPLASWVGHQSRILFRLVVDSTPVEDQQHHSRSKPIVHDTRDDDRSQGHHYAQGEPLATAAEVALLKKNLASQLAIVDVPSGLVEHVGTPDFFDQAVPSPSGEYLFLQTISPPDRPGSALTRLSSREIRRLSDGAVVAELLAKSSRPVAAHRSRRSRGWKWHPLEPAVIVWIEEGDSGDERLVSLSVPSHPEEFVVLQSGLEGCIGFDWTTGGRLLIRDRRREGSLCLRVCHGLSWVESISLVTGVQNANDPLEPGRCDAPSTLSAPMVTSWCGHSAVIEHERSIYVQRVVHRRGGLYPILERLDIDTGSATPVFESEPNAYETVVALLQHDAGLLLTLKEGPRAPARHCLLDTRLMKRTWLDSGEVRSSAVSLALRRPCTYAHPDGRTLSTTAYLPRQTIQRDMPFLIWLYPQVRENPYRPFSPAPNQYLRLSDSSVLPLIADGYGVIDAPEMPLDNSSDRVLTDLLASAESLVEGLVETGLADSDRIAIGGYSLGAWAAALLLAHTQLFCAGIVCSGVYNLTVVPLGSFQTGWRRLWEAPDRFVNLSPMFVADRIQAPLLIIEGQSESGADRVSAGRQLYSAISALRGTTRYVGLPHEGHWYTARESHLRMQCEILNWCDKYVKPSPSYSST